MADWTDRVTNIRLDHWVYVVMDGLLVGRVAERRDGMLDVWMAE